MTNHEQLHILVVEDEDMLRANLEVFFEDEGQIIYAASSGEMGLDVLMQNPGIQCAIVDIRLPKMTGDEFMLKALTARPDLKVIVYTGSSHYNFPDYLQKLGMHQDLIFLKPMRDMSKLLNFLKELMN